MAARNTVSSDHESRHPRRSPRIPRNTSKLKTKYSTKCAALRIRACNSFNVSSEADGNSQDKTGPITLPVAAEEKSSLESNQIQPAQARTGPQFRNQRIYRGPSGSRLE